MEVMIDPKYRRPEKKIAIEDTIGLKWSIRQARERPVLQQSRLVSRPRVCFRKRYSTEYIMKNYFPGSYIFWFLYLGNEWTDWFGRMVGVGWWFGFDGLGWLG